MTAKGKTSEKGRAAVGQSSNLENTPSAGKPPGHEEIALRAYELYVERGCVSGRELDDWLQAESELREKSS